MVATQTLCFPEYVPLILTALLFSISDKRKCLKNMKLINATITTVSGNSLAFFRIFLSFFGLRNLSFENNVKKLLSYYMPQHGSPTPLFLVYFSDFVLFLTFFLTISLSFKSQTGKKKIKAYFNLLGALCMYTRFSLFQILSLIQNFLTDSTVLIFRIVNLQFYTEPPLLSL